MLWGLHWSTFPLVFLAGAVAGVINALAGSGSLITLPALVMLGLPSPVANGTNRVGNLVQCLIGAETYRRGGRLDAGRVHWFVWPTVTGALVGAWLASRLGPEGMDTAIGLVMVGMLGILWLEPSQWLRSESSTEEGRPPAWQFAVFFAAGIYGGFIQAGVGIMLLAALVLGAGYEVVEANATKLVVAAVMTGGALAVFAARGLVHWKYGALMAVGQGLGAWAGASFAVEHARARLWIRRLLIAVALVAGAEFLGVREALVALFR